MMPIFLRIYIFGELQNTSKYLQHFFRAFFWLRIKEWFVFFFQKAWKVNWFCYLLAESSLKYQQHKKLKVIQWSKISKKKCLLNDLSEIPLTKFILIPLSYHLKIKTKSVFGVLNVQKINILHYEMSKMVVQFCYEMYRNKNTIRNNNSWKSSGGSLLL